MNEEEVIKAMNFSYEKGKEEAEENAYTKFRKDKSNWITFDDEIQKQIYYKIKDWKERGRKDSNTFFTDSIYRVIARLLEDEKQETLKKVRDVIDNWKKERVKCGYSQYFHFSNDKWEELKKQLEKLKA